MQEHVLNDIRYNSDSSSDDYHYKPFVTVFFRHPLEMHMIHVNRKYNSIDEALEHRDGLTVLGELWVCNAI